MKLGDIIKYKKQNNDTDWDRIKGFVGIIVNFNEKCKDKSLSILWNNGELLIHSIPPYIFDEHFEIIK